MLSSYCPLTKTAASQVRFPFRQADRVDIRLRWPTVRTQQSGFLEHDVDHVLSLAPLPVE